MKTLNCHIQFIHRLLLIVVLATFALSTISCGSDKEEEEIAAEAAHRQNRYELVEKIARQYCNRLMSLPAEGMEVEELLMNINSRSHALMEQGDTLTALYFRQMVEEEVRARDADHADLIFGPRPYSVFLLEE